MSNQINSNIFPLILEAMNVKRVYFTSKYRKNRFEVTLFCKPPERKKMKFQGFGANINDAFLQIIFKLQSLDNLPEFYKEEQISVNPFQHCPKSTADKLRNSTKYAIWQLKRSIRFYENITYERLDLSAFSEIF